MGDLIIIYVKRLIDFIILKIFINNIKKLKK